jgi:hypothetical protein
MMKPAGDGDRWVFNNISDNVTKTHEASARQPESPRSTRKDLEAREEEYQEVE